MRDSLVDVTDKSSADMFDWKVIRSHRSAVNLDRGRMCLFSWETWIYTAPKLVPLWLQPKLLQHYITWTNPYWKVMAALSSNYQRGSSYVRFTRTVLSPLFVQLMHTNYCQIVKQLTLFKLQKLLQHVSVYTNHHQGVRYCGCIRSHNTGNFK